MNQFFSYVFVVASKNKVPVIRIFGTDAVGVKTCAHVHGVFPYLYVPYAGAENQSDADRLAYQLAASLDKAINISCGQTNSTAQHIFKIIVVKGVQVFSYFIILVIDFVVYFI